MLTRELISTGAYLDSFQDLPQQPLWTRERIETSMHAALAQRDTSQPVWLFAYGSLIWNPLIHYEELQPAVLHGWQRSFCIRLLEGRGSVEVPGRMLALRQGGQTAGMAFRLGEQDLLDELWLVWVREMVHGLYDPIWTTTCLYDGRAIQLLTFVANPAHPMYEVDGSVASASTAIAQARGHLGSNREYLMSLEKSLADNQISDAYILELAGAVRALSEGIVRQ